jgi:hypothetical protein
MQTQWGAAESCASDGSKACPLLTWDAKATTALAILGAYFLQLEKNTARGIRITSKIKQKTFLNKCFKK